MSDPIDERDAGGPQQGGLPPGGPQPAAPPPGQAPEGRSGLPQVWRNDLPELRRAMPRYEEPEEEVISLRQYLDVLLRRKWLLVAVAATVLLIAALQIFTATPIFKATSRLQIDPESANILPYQDVTADSENAWNLEPYIWTQAEKLQSRTLAQRVVEKLDLPSEPGFTQTVRRGILLDIVGLLRGAVSAVVSSARPEEDEESLYAEVARLQGNLQIRPLRNTRLLEVSFLSPDPALAAAVANTVAEEFIELHLEGKFDATIRATEFLRSQLDDLKIRVEESEEDLLAYAKAKGIVNLSDRETINRKKLVDLNDELTRVESEMIAQEARYQAAQRASLETFPGSLENEAIRATEARISEIRRELAAFSSRYGPEWPAVKEARSELSELQLQLAEEQRLAVASATSDYRVTSDRYAKLKALESTQRGLVDKLDEDSIQYNILKREVDTTKELYEGLLQRLKEAGVAAGLRSSNISVADLAAPPRSWYSPKKARSLALALVLGLFLGVGAVFLAEALDNTLKSSDDITEKLGLPALGVVPILHLAGEAETQAKWFAFGAQKVAETSRPVIAGSAENALRGRGWESYRSLRTALLLSHSGSPPQTIMVTSALPAEGKTTTASNLALAFAQTGARTALVGLDLRKPSVGDAFGLANAEGMSTFLSGNTDLSSLIQETEFDHLFVVPGGPSAPNPPELIGSELMLKALVLLRDYFTHIVFDCPPCLELSDALVLAPKVDGVVLVVKAGATPVEAVRKAGDQLQRVGGELLGVVLNQADERGSGYGYGYGYGYGDHYDGYFDQQKGGKKTA